MRYLFFSICNQFQKKRKEKRDGIAIGLVNVVTLLLASSLKNPNLWKGEIRLHILSLLFLLKSPVQGNTLKP